MRSYEKGRKEKLTAVICNRCGRSLKVEDGVLKEGCFHGSQVFGYFSSMDGKSHSFDLCETCYQKLTAQFMIPAEEEECTELL